MHHVNIRADLHRPPFVSIGKPMPLSSAFPAKPDEPASSAEIAEARAAAVSSPREALAAAREAPILDCEPEDIAEIDLTPPKRPRYCSRPARWWHPCS